MGMSSGILTIPKIGSATTRQPPIDGAEPPPRIRVEVVHRHQPRQCQHHQIPPWVIAMVIFAALFWLSPFGMVAALVMGGILVTSHPVIDIAIGVTVALVVIIEWRERRAGRHF